MEYHKLFYKQIGDYIIKQCTKTDLPQVISINLNSLPEHYSDSFYESALKECGAAFLIAERDQQVVGYIMCRVEHGFSILNKFKIKRKGHITSFAVLEEHRNKGIGKNLIEESTKALKEMNCNEIFLEVRVTNTVAIELYKKLGFMIISKIRWYYRDGESAYLMGKLL